MTSPNVFDIRTALLANHAQHVVVIHFPIALFITAAGLDFLLHWTKNQGIAPAVYCNFLLAAIFTLPSVVSGIAAWQWALQGQRVKGILMIHLVSGCISAVLMWIVLLIHSLARRDSEHISPKFRLLVEAFAVVIVAITGHVGGFLSGVNG